MKLLNKNKISKNWLNKTSNTECFAHHVSSNRHFGRKIFWMPSGLSLRSLVSQSGVQGLMGRKVISDVYLRWLNTVLRAVSGNSLDGACFKLDKQTWRWKKAMVHRRQFLKIYALEFCDIWQNFYFYCAFNNKNFKMEVEQTNFVTHLMITVKSHYWLSKTPSVKIWSNKFQIVMINHSKLCASL